MKTDQEAIKRVVVGMSGGVDSSLVAALLVEQGYEVMGVFLECWRAPGCRVDEDRRDAMDVALKLEIPFEVLDFKEAYKKKVVDYFYAEYAAGRTPNPDVVCNKEIKFGMFYDWAMEEGFDVVATGHYARIEKVKSQKLKAVYQLMRGVDEGKDQSYFLYQLREEQLAHILFPLGEMKKNEVREEARKRGLQTANKPDSQGICFIGEISTETFLKDLGMREEEGEVVNLEGKVVGRHKGAWFYTVGQRHGFEVAVQQPDMPPLFVVAKDVELNRLVVGEREESMADELQVSDLHWVRKSNEQQAIGNKDIRVRIRNLGELVPAQLKMQNETLMVRFERSVFGVAPGQAAVFYKGDEVLGGGIIA